MRCQRKSTGTRHCKLLRREALWVHARTDGPGLAARERPTKRVPDSPAVKFTPIVFPGAGKGCSVPSSCRRCSTTCQRLGPLELTGRLSVADRCATNASPTIYLSADCWILGAEHGPDAIWPAPPAVAHVLGLACSQTHGRAQSDSQPASLGPLPSRSTVPLSSASACSGYCRPCCQRALAQTALSLSLEHNLRPVIRSPIASADSTVGVKPSNISVP